MDKDNRIFVGCSRYSLAAAAGDKADKRKTIEIVMLIKPLTILIEPS
jgi:hypothetical protein